MLNNNANIQKPKVGVQVGNSYCKITGLDAKQEKELKTILSYEIDAKQAYFSGSYRNTRCLLGKHGDFPTGLLHQVESYLKNTPYQKTDTRVVPKPAKQLFALRLPYPPYPEQKSAVIACKRSQRGTISAVTGFGKSITMALLVQELQLKTLIIVPTLELKNQLKESFTRYFGTLNHVTIENIDSKNLKTATDYDVLMIDEAHHVAAKTYRTLNRKTWNKIYYRFFFTATPFRSRDEEQLLFESIAGQVIYRVDYPTAVKNKYIVPLEAYYVELPKRKEVKGYTWAEVYNELVVNNKERNTLIAHLLDSLHESNVPTLCLVKEIQHGENILKQSKSVKNFVKGENEDNKETLTKFNQCDIIALIGTTGVLGEGVDTKPAEYVIVAGLGKSKNALMQQFGRGFRTYPGKHSCKVILFKDPSHKWTKAHFAAQCKLLKEEYNVLPTRLDLCLK